MRSFLVHARSTLWSVVLGYYLGELKVGDANKFEAFIRVLNYASSEEFLKDMCDINHSKNHANRFRDAYYRLFAKAGLDFGTTPSDVLFDAFVKMVDQLPGYWLQRIRSELEDGNCLSLMRVPRFYARFAPGACSLWAHCENYLWSQ